jgi:7,8-dihydropterin-6-yl-methyl-4-(beta-D-ribofuranosyl)aminobenzene 5'-phosphate synthase
MDRQTEPAREGIEYLESSGPVITVVFDNNPGPGGLRTGWGFACVVRGTSETILFDTGASGATLLANMEALGVDPA